MLESGYIKLYRSLTKWEWYDDMNTFKLFMHLLLTANYETVKWHGITVKKGQRVCSLPVLSKETRMSVQNLRTSLNKLKLTGEISDVATNNHRLITIENWGIYQNEEHENKGQLTGDQQTTNRQLTAMEESNKKDNKDNKARRIKNARTHEESSSGAANRPPESVKKCFLTTVRLTDGEYDSLKKMYGETDTERLIEILEEYKVRTGKPYNSDYSAITKWVVKKLAYLKESEPKTNESKMINLDDFAEGPKI